MDQRVVLDEKSFKALSADSRVNILKNLSGRRRTLTELSQKLNLENSTVKEHCTILMNAELIKLIDEGRKWKYYELTQKGKQLIHPSLMEEVKVLIMLCLGITIGGGFVFFLLQSFWGITSSGTMNTFATVTDNYAGAQSTSLTKEAAIATGTSPSTVTTVQQAAQITPEILLVSVVIALIVGILLGWYFTRKK